MTDLILNIGCFMGAFCVMEIIAWATHKYIMHGILWVLHKDHHKRIHHPFEWNDLFFILFAAAGIYFLYNGYAQMNWMFFTGLGITAYGIAYVFVHDIFVHGRIKIFRNLKHPYLDALKRAHKKHHSTDTREHGENFGFLWVSKKYWKK